MTEIDPTAALKPTPIIDCDNEAIREFALPLLGGCSNDREKAIRLYNAVRDVVRYDCYQIDLTPEGLTASQTLQKGYGWCVPKAVLLAACCRAAEIPAGVGFADVRNHLSTPRLLEMMGSDVFYYHGYTVIYLDGRWVKATPAFNRELCEKTGVVPLEFDGINDSIFHAFDSSDRRHMEYLRYHGEFADVPHAALVETLSTRYPKLMKLREYEWSDDVDQAYSGDRRAE